jgi:hypothetical protein
MFPVFRGHKLWSMKSLSSPLATTATSVASYRSPTAREVSYFNNTRNSHKNEKHRFKNLSASKKFAQCRSWCCCGPHTSLNSRQCRTEVHFPTRSLHSILQRAKMTTVPGGITPPSLVEVWNRTTIRFYIINNYN